MESLYDVVGISRQGFFDNEVRRAQVGQMVVQIIAQVKEIRCDHPRMSARKVYRFMQNTPQYASYVAHMGRDKLEMVLMNNGLRVRKAKSYLKTTIRGPFVFKNLIQGFTPTAINQVWVSDITYYITVQSGKVWHFYITLIMDLFSREGIGFAASKTMRTEDTALAALQKAIKYRNFSEQDKYPHLIFHSDGGGQYSDKGFLNQLAQYQIQSSMSKSVYDNPFAERLNGIIKNEYLIPWEVNSFAELELLLPKAIKLYNNQRPHLSLNWNTPSAFAKSNAPDISMP